MNSKYFFFKLFILLVISLLPINTFAQFTINGKRPAYDKTTNTYLVSIPQNVFYMIMKQAYHLTQTHYGQI